MADTCHWEKVYEHDAAGNPVSGSLPALLNAVAAGADVKVHYAAPGGPTRVDWYRLCPAVTVAGADGGDGSIVSCMVTDIPDSDLTLSIGRSFATPFAFEWQAYNTTGQRHTVKFDRKTLSVLSDNTDSLGLAWYVRR